jgi:hypothetical protein
MFNLPLESSPATGCPSSSAVTRHLRTEGVKVIEVDQPEMATHRRRVRPMPSMLRPLLGLCCQAGPPQQRG